MEQTQSRADRFLAINADAIWFLSYMLNAITAHAFGESS